MAGRRPGRAQQLDPVPRAPDRSRGLLEELLDAVLTGQGCEGVATAAARAAGAPVAIVAPRMAVAAAAPSNAATPEMLAKLSRYAAVRLGGEPAPLPAAVLSELEFADADGDPLGLVLLLRAGDALPAEDVLEPAALAVRVEAAIADAREDVVRAVRGSLLEELRDGGAGGDEEVVRRAARLGCDLSEGAVALCIELTSGVPHQALAAVRTGHPGALAERIGDRLYALLPAAGTDDDALLEAAAALASRLERYGLVGYSSPHANVGELGRAIEEAELVLGVLRQAPGPISDGVGSVTYRLLLRVFASHPDEISRFYDGTIAPLVAYDEQYGTGLVATLEAYFENDCSMNATAAAIYAHRHTIAYRLDRIRELSGLDPGRSEDRERLGLGLKAYRIVRPRLHR